MTSLSSDALPPAENPRTLRSRLRLARRQLSFAQQKSAARLLARQVMNSSSWQRSRRIAFYQAVGGEIDPLPLMKKAWQQGKACYLPVLHPFHRYQMLFVRVWPHTRCQRNRWGIAEPVPRPKHRVKPHQLDLVLMPLVGFDEAGNRIGMGQGFYDRAFAFRRTHTGRPVLTGLGHECQRVGQGIRPSAWDVPLDVLATPQGHKRIRTPKKP